MEPPPPPPPIPMGYKSREQRQALLKAVRKSTAAEVPGLARHWAEVETPGLKMRERAIRVDDVLCACKKYNLNSDGIARDLVEMRDKVVAAVLQSRAEKAEKAKAEQLEAEKQKAEKKSRQANFNSRTTEFEQVSMKGRETARKLNEQACGARMDYIDGLTSKNNPGEDIAATYSKYDGQKSVPRQAAQAAPTMKTGLVTGGIPPKKQPVLRAAQQASRGMQFDDRRNGVLHPEDANWDGFKKAVWNWLEDPEVRHEGCQFFESAGVKLECGACVAYGRICDHFIWPFGCDNCRKHHQAHTCNALHSDVSQLLIGILEKLGLKSGPYSGLDVPYSRQNRPGLSLAPASEKLTRDPELLRSHFDKFTHPEAPFSDGTNQPKEGPKRGFMLKFRNQFSEDGKQKKDFAHKNWYAAFNPNFLQHPDFVSYEKSNPAEQPQLQNSSDELASVAQAKKLTSSLAPMEGFDDE